MNYIKKIEGVKGFYFLKGEEVIVTEKNVQIGSLLLDITSEDDIFCKNNVLIKKNNNGDIKTQFLYKNGRWDISNPKYEDFHYFSEKLYYSSEEDEDAHLQKYSIIENGEEKLFEIKTELGIKLHIYDNRLSIYIFPEFQDKCLLFYTKDLQFLWKYQIDEPDFKIVANGVTIVDDIVVIVKRKKLTMTDFKFYIESFYIRTGQRKCGPIELKYNPSFRVGSNGIIYAIEQDEGIKFVVRLDPKKGELTEYEIKSNMINPDDRVNGHSFIDKNMMYFTSNSPVPTIGVINLETMQLLEYQKMKTEWDAWTTEDPIVTEDKVYLYVPLAEELHILQK